MICNIPLNDEQINSYRYFKKSRYYLILFSVSTQSQFGFRGHQTLPKLSQMFCLMETTLHLFILPYF